MMIRISTLFIKQGKSVMPELLSCWNPALLSLASYDLRWMGNKSDLLHRTASCRPKGGSPMLLLAIMLGPPKVLTGPLGTVQGQRSPASLKQGGREPTLARAGTLSIFPHSIPRQASKVRLTSPVQRGETRTAKPPRREANAPDPSHL